MKTDTLITQAQKIPEIESEVFWYLNKYRECQTHPWEKYINQFFLDFNICLPVLEDKFDKRLLIGLTILSRECDLIQGTAPGSYHLEVSGFGLLDEIKDPSAYILNSFARLVTIYFNANEANEIENLENTFENEIYKWNWHAWVKQEEISMHFGNRIKLISELSNIPDRKIPQVLDDYYSRIERKRLENLDKFLEKSTRFLNGSKKINEHASFFQFILEEINNGGENIESVYDILPQYSGIKFN